MTDPICELCKEPVTSDAVPAIDMRVHAACLLRSVMGGIGHLLDHDHFCTGLGDPDAGLSYYVSARLVQTYTSAVGVDAAITRSLPPP